MSAFGPIVPRRRAEQAVIDCLDRWFQTFLREAERQEDGRIPGRLPLPRSITRRGEIQRFPENKLPAIVVAAGRIPRTDRGAGGRGRYGAWVTVEVAIAATAASELGARDNVGLYVAAARSLLLARQSLDGPAAGVVWIGDEEGDEMKAGRRYMGSGQTNFEVLVRDVARVGGGPAQPDEPGRDPALEVPDEPPFDSDVDVTITAEEPHEDPDQP